MDQRDQPIFEPVSGSTFSVSQLVVVVCSTLSMYNAIELLTLVFTTFRQYKGLYFWSLLIASFGLLPYNLGFLTQFFLLAPEWVGVIVDVPGWVMVVTGQSMVLYSRLHLVLQNPKILRAVLWMIIVDAVVFHVTTTVVRFGAYHGNQQPNFRAAWNVVEKFQMTGFCVQEFIISGLYLYETVRLLKIVRRNNTRRTMWELLAVNIFIIALDIGLLVVEYQNLLVYEQTFKGVIYGIKLKLEFAILGKLVKMVRSGENVEMTFENTAEFVDATRTPSNIANPAAASKKSRQSGAGFDSLALDEFESSTWTNDNSGPSFVHIEKALMRYDRKEC